MLNETIGAMDINITHSISRKTDVKRYERLKMMNDEQLAHRSPDGIVTREREVRQ